MGRVRPTPLWFVLLAACTSNSASGGDAGGASPCKPAPSAGAACGASARDVTCEVGSDPSLACDSTFVCGGAGAWTLASSSDGGIVCTNQCAASYTEQQALTGTCAPDGRMCAFAQGTCLCVPPGQAQVDGGPVTQSSQWQCVDLASGCTFPRPRLGDPCGTPGQRCNYGACIGGVALECSAGGWWKQSLVPCPH
jgi:hypothetical protein